MEKIIKDIGQMVGERLRNTLIFSFLVSWVVCNWKGVAFFLLSDLKVEEKLRMVGSDYSNIYLYLIIPIIFSSFYVGGLPYLMLLFDWLKQWEFKIVQSRQHKKNVQKVKSNIELDILRAGGRDMESLNQEISSLKQLIEQKDKIISELQISNQFDEVDYDNTKNLVDKSELSQFHRMGTAMLQGEPLDNIIADKLTSKFNVLGLISSRIDGRGYSFTNKGLRMYEELNQKK